MLEGVHVVEVLGRLDDGDRRVVEVAQGVGQELGARYVVGVQDRDELGVEVLDRVVEVAGLRVGVVLAREVVGPEGLGERGHPRPLAVVEDPRFVGRPQRGRRGDGRQQHFGRLVVGRDEHGDASVARLDRRGDGRRVEVPEGEAEEAEAEDCVDLEQPQRDREPQRAHGEAHAPRQVGDAEREGDERRRANREAPVRRLGCR